MWKKPLVIILLFYIFALLQSSFFYYFSFFGIVPNLVFILFFLLVFFEKKSSDYKIILFAVIGGILLDILSYTYLGPSIVLLIAIGFLLKNIQLLLKNRQDSHPFVYFLPLFIIFLLAYSTLMDLCLYFLNPSKVIFYFDAKIFLSLFYNSLIASLLFFIYKKWRKFTK